jgi:hypothetical protein
MSTHAVLLSTRVSRRDSREPLRRRRRSCPGRPFHTEGRGRRWICWSCCRTPGQSALSRASTWRPAGPALRLGVGEGDQAGVHGARAPGRRAPGRRAPASWRSPGGGARRRDEEGPRPPEYGGARSGRADPEFWAGRTRRFGPAGPGVLGRADPGFWVHFVFWVTGTTSHVTSVTQKTDCTQKSSQGRTSGGRWRSWAVQSGRWAAGELGRRRTRPRQVELGDELV